MATFKKHTIIGMDSSLRESFQAIKDLKGISVIYDADQQQGTALALRNADDRIREISTEISKLYKRLEYGIKIDSAKHLEDFNRFSTLLIQAMKINDLMSGDDIILTKLAEILTYAYAKKANGQFQIFSDFDTAKRVTSIVFATAKKLGLKFFQSDLEDLVQKILLSVVYKEGSDKKDTKNDDKKADKPKEDKPTNQPTEPKDDPNGTDNQF